jgi:hypothetical protein
VSDAYFYNPYPKPLNSDKEKSIPARVPNNGTGFKICSTLSNRCRV